MNQPNLVEHTVSNETTALPKSAGTLPSWIWCGDTREFRHVWAWARRSFFVGQGEAVRLAISADLRYMVWINGQRVGFGPPKFHAETPTVDHYDLARFVQPGRNVIAVQVYSLGPEKISSCSPQRGALWVELRVGEQRLVSDEHWKMRRDPGYASEKVAWRGTQPPNECYDARRGLFRPWEKEHDDSEWPAARLLSTASIGELEDRDIPHMASERFLPDRLLECGIARFGRALADYAMPEMAAAIHEAELFPDRQHCIHYRPEQLSTTQCGVRAGMLNECEAAYFIWDMGRLWSGYPVLHASGTPGTVLDISYGEHLTNGRVNPAKSRMHYFDRVILGPRPLEHRVTWPKSARFIQLHVHGGAAKIERIAWERSTYPVVRTGCFASASGTLDHAVEISLHTVQICMEDSYMDTPWRERGSWLGDDLVKAQAAYDYFRDYALAGRFLLHHARGQRAGGMLQGKYPGNTTSNVSTWTLRFPPSLLEYCAASGDWTLAEDLWPALTRILGWMDSLQTPDGLFQAPPASVTEHSNHYNFIDWAPIDLRGINAAWNAFAYEALHCGEKIAQEIGEDAFAEKIVKKRRVLRAAFRARLWDERRGVFVNGMVDGILTERWGCHENYLALLYKLATPKQAARIVERLRRENLFTTFEANPEHCDAELPGLGKIPTVSLALSQYRWPSERMVPIGTPYFAGYMIEALCEAGMVREAMQFIEERWGNFSRQGATTVWETWNAAQSLSHGWSAIPAIFASRTLLGVRRCDTNGMHWQILPAIECLPSFRGRVATRFGAVQVEWTGDSLYVDVPQGATFSAGLPAQEEASLWVNGIKIENPVPVERNHIPYLSHVLCHGKTQLQMRRLLI